MFWKCCSSFLDFPTEEFFRSKELCHERHLESKSQLQRWRIRVRFKTRASLEFGATGLGPLCCFVRPAQVRIHIEKKIVPKKLVFCQKRRIFQNKCINNIFFQIHSFEFKKPVSTIFVLCQPYSNLHIEFCRSSPKMRRTFSKPHLNPESQIALKLEALPTDKRSLKILPKINGNSDKDNTRSCRLKRSSDKIAPQFQDLKS